MTSERLFSCHQASFVAVSSLLLAVESTAFLQVESVGVFVALLLFFGLGIPHGALDVSLGKLVFEKKCKRYWPLAFFSSYLACACLVIVLWVKFPLASFLFFLAISSIHFGFSDTNKSCGLLYYLEGFARGVLPITIPASIFPDSFQQLVENSLVTSDALVVVRVVQSFFYPDLLAVGVLIFYGFFQKNKKDFLNSFELLSLLVLFICVKPFAAFLIYFCFLHSIRHILTLFEEMQLPYCMQSVKWLMVQALPATFATLAILALAYFYWKNDWMDLGCMINIFFISLAALTFPHMLLVECLSFTSRPKK